MHVTKTRKTGQHSNGSGRNIKLPIIDQYAYLGVDVLKDCSWHAPCTRSESHGTGQSTRIGGMDAILTNPHLDTINGIKMCIPINAIVPELKYAGEVREGHTKFLKQLETLQMTGKKARVLQIQ